MGYSKAEILLIDNRDSFTHNLVHVLKSIGAQVWIQDACKVLEYEPVNFKNILFSPGPGLPKDFPLMFEILQQFQPTQAILGICLGHQAIAQFFGAELFQMEEVQHGQQKTVFKTQITGKSILNTLPESFEVGLYHSWAVNRYTLPDCLQISCISDEDIIMGITHQKLNIEGLQFHPESFMTKLGIQLLHNWIFQ